MVIKFTRTAYNSRPVTSFDFTIVYKHTAGKTQSIVFSRLRNIKLGDCRDATVVKSTCCSSRTPVPLPVFMLRGSQLPITPPPGDPVFPSGFFRHYTHVTYTLQTQTFTQKQYLFTCEGAWRCPTRSLSSPQLISTTARSVCPKTESSDQFAKFVKVGWNRAEALDTVVAQHSGGWVRRLKVSISVG